MPDIEIRSFRRRIFAVRALTAAFVGLVLDWRFGGLKFAEASLNFAAAIMALCLPFVLFGLVLALPRRLSRTLGLVAIVPLMLFCLLLLPLACLFGPDPGFERVHSISGGGSEVVSYVTDGGAMTSCGIVVQQEKQLMPGLLWVKPLCREYPADDVSVVLLDRHHLRCTFPPYGDGRPEWTQQEAWIF